MTNLVAIAPGTGVVNSIKIQDWEFTLAWRGHSPVTPLKEICEATGLSWKGQSRRIKSTQSSFNYLHIQMVAADGKPREMLCLPVAELHTWLSGINLVKVSHDVANRIIALKQAFFDTFVGSVVNALAAERDKAIYFARKSGLTFLRKDRMASHIKLSIDRGLTFSEIRATGPDSWSKAKIAEKIALLVLLGEIDAAPLGTPVFHPPKDVVAEPHGDQLQLFSEG